MIKAIMAVDEKGGISKGQSMPWPKNSIDLKWFKENTINNIVVMGRKTWDDPFMPTPLKSRINPKIPDFHRKTFIFHNFDIIISHLCWFLLSLFRQQSCGSRDSENYNYRIGSVIFLLRLLLCLLT